MGVSHRITAFLVHREIIPADEEIEKIYEYGLELLLGDVMNFLFILLLSIALQNIGTGALYLLCFVSVRIFAGGFHAKTHIRCSLAMVIWYLMFCVLNVFLAAADWKILAIGTLLAYVPLIRYAPVPNGNRPLSRINRRKCRGRAVSVYTLWVLLSVFFTSFGVWTGTVFFSALWMVSANIVFVVIVRFFEGGDEEIECV